MPHVVLAVVVCASVLLHARLLARLAATWRVLAEYLRALRGARPPPATNREGEGLQAGEESCWETLSVPCQ